MLSMEKNFFLLVCFLAVTVMVKAEEDVDPDVVKATEDNFDDIVSQDLVLMEFYAPWCGHCKNLLPAYAEAATRLKDHGITLAKLDSTEHGSVSSKYGVRGYPTLKVFRNGEYKDYNGPRDADGIVKYMLKQAKPSSTVLNTKEEVENFISNSEPTVIYFATAKGSNYNNFKAVANDFRDEYRFGECLNEEVVQEYGYVHSAVVFKPRHHVSKLDEPTAVISKFSQTELVEFINENALPLVAQITEDTEFLFVQKNRPVVIYSFETDYESNAKQTNYKANKLRKVVKNFVGEELSFAVANIQDEGMYAFEATELGLKEEGVYIKDLTTEKKYKMETSFSPENVATFIQAFIDLELEPYVKSEPVPKDNSAGTKVVVGKTFDEFVLDESKDVLLEMYAPWCGHCKQLEPIYSKLGDKFKDVDNLIIAKMDATANDFPSEYGVRGYPTIYWIPKGPRNGSPEKFEGDRTLEGMTKFLKKNSVAWKEHKAQN